MFAVSLFNGEVETVIHYPSADKDTTHLLNLPFKESLSKAEELSFALPFGNPGYYIIEGLISRIKVIDTRDDSVIFSGRVLNTREGMSADGSFINNVICEGALNYLVDSQTRRWNFTNQTPTQILTYLLAQHNGKVEASKQIQVGVIELTQPITIDTNYETTLNTIITKLRNILGGDISVRETAGVLYLDYLTDQGVNNGVAIQIGVNAKQLIREYNPTDVTTRAIPLGYGEGINQLDITSANGGVEYIEDATAKAKYGVIEQTVINKDIQNAYTLKIYGQTVLAEKKQPKLIIDTAMVDRSVLAQYELEKYALGDTLYIADYDLYARVIERSRDLILSPWEPTQVISTRPITLSEQIVDLRQRSATLEQSPQGSTFITVFNQNDNLDATHSIKIPVWLSPDILNVNRVRLFVESQKFRAYEKGMAAGGSSTATSSSGGGSTVTSSNGGSSTATSASGGGATTSVAGMDTESTYDAGIVDGVGADVMGVCSDQNGVRLQQHFHYTNWQHNHNGPIHQHTVPIPNHQHTSLIPNHQHTSLIPEHAHAIDYGIFEDTFTAGSKIKINGVIVADGPNNGESIDIDITPWIGTPGQTYIVEVTSTQRGRVAVQVNVQAFIQTK